MTSNHSSKDHKPPPTENKGKNYGEKVSLLVENLRETYRWHGYLLDELAREIKKAINRDTGSA